jgi:nucleoside-diphosphate-sugar epimerase
MNIALDATTRNWLVIGADGVIGSAVVRRLAQSGISPWVTTRRPDTLGSRRYFWELGRPLPMPEDLVSRHLIAVIAIGGKSVRECEENPDATHHRNVVEFGRLIAQLRSVAVRIVFFSTNLVFDPSILLPSETSPAQPRTQYGRQKVAVEQLLRQDGREPVACVLRLTKTLPARWPLLERWEDEFRRTGAIRPYSRMACAPLPAEFVAETVVRAALQPEVELLHVSPRDDVSYVDIAGRWACRLGGSAADVTPQAPEADGLTFDVAPIRTALDSSRLEQTLGLTVPASWDTLDAIMDEMRDRNPAN